MAKISEMNVLTEKGVLKNGVRTSIKGHDSVKVADTLETLGFEYVADKNAYVKTRVDMNGVEIYTVLTMTVTTKHPSDLAERKPKAKTPSDPNSIEIE